MSSAELVLKRAQSFDDVLPTKLANALLWHYTSVAGALGILEHRSLRLGPVRMMNDEGELDYGLALIGERLEARYAEIDARDAELAAELKAVYNFAKYGNVQQLYAACASTDPQSLSQIRGYGEYIIGVNADVKLHLRVPEPRSAPDPTRPDPATTHGVFVSEWRPVCYDEKPTLALIENAIVAVVDIALEGLNAVRQYGQSTMLPLLGRVDAAAKLVACAAFIKHPAFRSENEVRVLASVPIRSRIVELREGKYGVTPYVTVEAVPRERRSPLEDASFISSVRLGPGDADTRTALFGLEQAMDHLGYSIIPEPVAIPFRSR